MPTRAGAMLANVPSSQVVLSQLKFPAAWHSYFTASPSEDVVECLQVSRRFLFGHIVASDAMHAGDEQRVWPGRVQAVRLLALPSLYFCNTQAGTCCLWSIGTRTRRRDVAHCAVEIWRLVYVFVCANMG
jgi:hypothetical protein